MLIAALRDKGLHPCPHCLITFQDIPNLGTPFDRQLRDSLAHKDENLRHQLVTEARRLIYEEGYAINGEKVDRILRSLLAVPIVVRLCSK